MHPRLEELDTLSPATLLLRRRSNISRAAKPANAAENCDEMQKNQLSADEAEKLRYLRLRFVFGETSPRIADDVSHCIKVCPENTIFFII